MKNKLLTLLIYFIIYIVIPACKKYIQVDSPPTSLSTVNVFTDNATAAGAITAIYAQISNLGTDITSNGMGSITTYTGLSGDELTLYNLNDVRFAPFYLNNVNATTTSGQFWITIYPIIYYVNSAVEQISSSSSLAASVQQQLLGEAKFIRAFCYFNLINLYGDVPVVLTSDYKVNALLPKSNKTDVYNQIIADLLDAQNLLSANYLRSDAQTAYSINTAQRVRPTKAAATALLARVYLFVSDYVNAEKEATAVINNSAFYSLDSLNDVFKMNSTETIWALQPVGTAAKSNTGDGILFVLPATGPSSAYPVFLSENVVNSFELNDKRKTNWTNSVVVGNKTYYYPYKYKIGAVNTTTSEYSIVLRLAEQYLIRAEARLQQGNVNDAKDDLNIIRKRAGLPSITVNDKAALLAAILHERQVELFTEWGHRWFDLKRTDNVDAVMTVVAASKGTTWKSYQSLYPIPNADVKADPNLTQTPGY